MATEYRREQLKVLEEHACKLLDDLESGMSNNDYMVLYSGIYNYCSASCNDMANGDVYSKQMFGARIVGDELYTSFKKMVTAYLNKLVVELEKVNSNNILEVHSAKWKQYLTSCKILNHLYQYMNSHWIKRQRDEGIFNVFVVKDAMMVEWRIILFEKLKSKLVQASLDLIEAHRSGENIPTDHVKSFVESCNCIGIFEGADVKANPVVYKQDFEAPFLTKTLAFYERECKPFLDAHGIIEYMKKVDCRLKEEDDRIDSYLHHSSRDTLITQCEKLLIHNFFPSFEAEFPNLLTANRTDDLQRMYKLLSRVKDSLVGLRNTFETYVNKYGLDALASLATSSNPGPTNDDGAEEEKKDEKLDPKAYVETLFGIYKKFHALIASCFDGDSGFEAALDKAFREFSNRNPLCASSTKSPELMAKYSDSILRKGAKDDSIDVEESLNNLMTIFRYIEDKDVFQKFYTNSLAKRLVNGLSASEDSEASMINKLKELCGVDYTSKLSRMFTDVGVCREMNEQFKQHLGNISFDLNVDFYVMVLVSNSWPFHASSINCTIPSEIEPCIEKFTRFYNTKHNGRKLNWLTHLSRGEVKAKFSPESKSTYHFQVSTYQMAILLQYNNADSHTVDELTNLTNISGKDLQGILGILCKAKVLLASDNDTKYSLNTDYKSKKLRMNLNIAIRSEQRNESQETHKNVEADRQMLIQAAIVRIMKTRKTLRHVQLVTEVIEQLQSRFKPSVPSIKKQIDTLIDKDYLCRSEETRDLLNYVA